MSATEWNALAGQGSPLLTETAVTLHRPVGCEACAQKGYSGRVSIAEIVEVDRAVRGWIEHGKSVGTMQEQLRASGVPFMRDDGLAKALAGLTSVEEIARVVQLESEEVLDDA